MFFFLPNFLSTFSPACFFLDDMRLFSKEPDGWLYVFLVRGLGRSLDSRYSSESSCPNKRNAGFLGFLLEGSPCVKIRDRDRGTRNPPKSALVGEIG